MLSAWAGSSAPVTHCTLPRSRPWRVAFIGDSITRGNTTFGRQPPLEDGPPRWSTAVGCWPCELAARARADSVKLELYNLGVWGVPVLSRVHTTKGRAHSSPPLDELLDGRLARSCQYTTHASEHTRLLARCYMHTAYTHTHAHVQHLRTPGPCRPPLQRRTSCS